MNVLLADPHHEDDHGRVIARLPGAQVAVGDVVPAGDEDGWEWMRVEEIADGFAHLRRVVQGAPCQA